MEYVAIAALLERYWEAETTLEEEQILADYFRQPAIDKRLEPYRAVFGYFEVESKVKASEDLESRILKSILSEEEAAPTAPVRKMTAMRIQWWAAAAVVACIILFSVFQPMGHGDTIKDTYDNPRDALAAFQKALLKVSVNMNKGKDVTRKQMGKMTDAWETAITN